MASVPAGPLPLDRRHLSLASRLPAVDLAGPLVAVVAGGVYALAGWDGVLKRDFGLFVYGGQHVLDGQPPYVDVFNRVGPLADLLPAAGIWLGRPLGLDDVHAARGFFLVLSALCVWALYVAARDLLGSRALALVACAAFACFRDFTDLAGNGPREKTAMLLFLLLTLVAVQRSRWYLAGTLTALATLTWQPALLPLVVVGLATAVERRRAVHPVAAAGRFVAGGAVTVAGFVAYFWSQHSLSTALEGFVLVNLTSTSQPSPLTHAGYARDLLTEGYGWSVVLVAVGVLGLLGLVRRSWPVVLGGWAAVGWSLYAFNGAPDLFVVLPFAAIGVAVVVRPAVIRAVGEERLRRVPAVVVVVALLVAAAQQSWSLRSDGLLVQEASARTVLSDRPPGGEVVSFGAPEALALMGLTNPTSYQLFSGGFARYLQQVWPGGFDGYVAWVRRSQPALVAVDAHLRAARVEQLLSHQYVRVGGAPGWYWFARTDLSRNRLAGPAHSPARRRSRTSRLACHSS